MSLRHTKTLSSTCMTFDAAHQSWSKDKTASKLMEQMDLADLQDYYEKGGQKHRELVEYVLQIDHFIDGLA